MWAGCSPDGLGAHETNYFKTKSKTRLDRRAVHSKHGRACVTDDAAMSLIERSGEG
jgi:hypothetical protein